MQASMHARIEQLEAERDELRAELARLQGERDCWRGKYYLERGRRETAVAESERLRACIDRALEQACAERDQLRARIEKSIECLSGRHESVCSVTDYGDRAGCDCVYGDVRDVLGGVFDVSTGEVVLEGKSE